MKRILILTTLCLLCAGTLWAQNNGTEKVPRKGVSVTGMTRDGCVTARFVDSVGGIKNLPKLERTGRRLRFQLVLLDAPQDCGTTDEEAILAVNIDWEGDYLPKIVERGLFYKIDSTYDGNETDEAKKARYDSIHQKIDLTISDCGDGEFKMMVDSLQPKTKYKFWAYAKTINDSIYLSDTILVSKTREKCGGWVPFSNESADNDSIDLVYDHDNRSYGVVQIGRQCWTRENMRCTKSTNRLIVPAQLIRPASGNLNEKYETSQQAPYRYDFVDLFLSDRQRGFLYNWPAAVDTSGPVTELPPGKRQGICPDGWHVPDVYEWYELILHELNGNNTVGTLQNIHNKTPEWNGDSVVKLTFGCEWPVFSNTPPGNRYPGGFMDSIAARNTSGFSALPASNVQDSGTLGWTKDVANFWLATPDTSASYASKFSYSWHIDHDQYGVSSYARPRSRGFSVRCIRDQLTIAVNPNTSRFCVPSIVTYTAKMPSIRLNDGSEKGQDDFTYKWTVNGTEIEETTRTLTYIHDVQGKFKIECEAHLTIGGNDSIFAADSVFVKGVGECNLISISPANPCLGKTVTVTAQQSGFTLTGNITAWKINTNTKLDDNDNYFTDTSFIYTFNDTSSVTFEVFLNSGLESSLSNVVHSLTVKPSNSLPSITVCPDCDVNGFVIKATKKISTSTNVTDNVIWRDADGDAIAYSRRTNDTVKIAEFKNPYSIEMVSTDGCRDTLRNIWHKSPANPCHVDVMYDTEEGDENTAGGYDIHYVKDHQDNRYSVVQIGNQCWLRENMRATTSPSHNTNIVNANGLTETAATQSYITPVAHWYKNTLSTYGRYGLLYNWCAAADTSLAGSEPGNPWSCQLPANWRGICPEGWHLPTHQEWSEMELVLNGGSAITNDTLAGLLAGGCDWNTTTTTTPNSPGDYNNVNWGASGFSAMPAGSFNTNASNNTSMSDIGNKARFWTATENSQNVGQAYHRTLEYNKSSVTRTAVGKNSGMSVRCVRNVPVITLQQSANDNCSYTMTASFDKGNEDYDVANVSYKWVNNGDTITENSSNTLNFTYSEDTPSYRIVCIAMNNAGEAICKDSVDITLQNWPPTLSVCSDPYAFPIKVSSQNVTNAKWYLDGNLKKDGYDNYVDLEAGTYTVYLTNANGACLSKDVTITTVSTTCKVLTINSEYEHGDGNEIDSLYDSEHNRYAVVQIGNQCWMRENMRTTNDISSNPITNNNVQNSCTSGTLDGNTTSPASMYYDYCSSAIPLEHRGYLYNYTAAKAICPNGWHLPSLQEWKDLKVSVMGSENKAVLLAGGCDWTSSNNANAAGNYNSNERNSFGFTMIPAGNLESNGNFAYTNTSAKFWTSTDKGDKSYRIAFANSSDAMGLTDVDRNLAYSVRCVRDIPDLTLQCFVTNANNGQGGNEKNIGDNNSPILLIDSVKDAGNNWYGVVQIGSRCWTRENMRSTKTSDGSPIPIGQSGNITLSLTTKYYYDYNPSIHPSQTPNHTTVDIPLKYRGYLYNWVAANAVCPTGWHLPSSDEWQLLVDAADNNTNTAKLAGYSEEYWRFYNTPKTPGYCATSNSHDYCDSLNISLVPAGNMSEGGAFDYGGNSANLWTSKENSEDKAQRVCFDYNQSTQNQGVNQNKKRGFSVRCIRDL